MKIITFGNFPDRYVLRARPIEHSVWLAPRAVRWLVRPLPLEWFRWLVFSWFNLLHDQIRQVNSFLVTCKGVWSPYLPRQCLTRRHLQNPRTRPHFPTPPRRIPPKDLGFESRLGPSFLPVARLQVTEIRHRNCRFWIPFCQITLLLLARHAHDFRVDFRRPLLTIEVNFSELNFATLLSPCLIPS